MWSYVCVEHHNAVPLPDGVARIYQNVSIKDARGRIKVFWKQQWVKNTALGCSSIASQYVEGEISYFHHLCLSS